MSVPALVGTAWLEWQRGINTPSADTLFAIPGLLYAGRLCWHAAFRGATPTEQHAWPFASEGLLSGYLLLNVLLLFVRR